MRRHAGFFLFLLCVIFLTVCTFRQYFFNGLVPFPGNLLVSFFAPWNTVRFPGWEHGVPNKPMGIDNLNLFYPYKDLSIDVLKKRIIPLWNPYNFTGNVLLANFQSSIFYPLNILYFLLPHIDAWSWMIMIQPVMAGLFTYLFLRCFPIKKNAAMFGALVFAFSGEMIVWMSDHLVVSHTILWLPLILWSIERFITTRKWYFYISAVTSLAIAFFAGFFQPFFYVWFVSLFYALYRLKITKPEKIVVLATITIFITSIGLEGVQLLPSWEALTFSPRNMVDVGYLYDTFLMPVRHLISFLVPDYLGNPGTYNFFGAGYHESVLFIGILPLLFALISIKRWKTNWTVRFFWILTITTLILGLNLPFIRNLYNLKIPIFYTFLPSRIFFITTFTLSILSAFGIDLWLKEKNDKDLIRILLGFFILLAFFWFYASFFWQLSAQDRQIVQRNIIIPALMIFLSLIIIEATYKVQKKSLALYGLVLLTIISQQYFTYKYLSFSYRQFTYPSAPIFEFIKTHTGFNRFWTYGDGYINANFATYERIFSPDGTDALFPSRLGELFYATETKGKLTRNIPRIDVRIARAEEGESMTDNQQRLRLLALVGAKYITDWTKIPDSENQQEKKFPSQLFSLVWQQNGWKVYELKNVLPRAFLTNQFMVEKDPQHILDTIFDTSHTMNEIILEETPSIQKQKVPVFRQAQFSSYAPNTVNIDVSTDTDSLLFLSDTYFPGWHAYVDGVPSKVYRADYAFRAVVIPAHTKTVRFIYEPESFRWGLYLSIFSVGATLLIARLLGSSEAIRF